MLIRTEFSVYEVLKEKRLIARRHSNCPPTERTGIGEWRPYRDIHAEVGFQAVILWNITADGVLQTTTTSTVLAIEFEDAHDA